MRRNTSNQVLLIHRLTIGGAQSRWFTQSLSFPEQCPFLIIADANPSTRLDNVTRNMFCEVRMPRTVEGKLFLHSMPGRYEPLDHTWEQLKAQRIAAIVCLARNDEISVKSQAYSRALRDGSTPCPVIRFEIPDYGVPEDRDVFLALARDVARRLLAAENILIHCGAGVGRSGTLAQCVLLALGQTLSAAYTAVTDAGSWAETPPQRELIRWCAAEVANRL